MLPFWARPDLGTSRRVFDCSSFIFRRGMVWSCPAFEILNLTFLYSAIAADKLMSFGNFAKSNHGPVCLKPKIGHNPKIDPKLVGRAKIDRLREAMAVKQRPRVWLIAPAPGKQRGEIGCEIRCDIAPGKQRHVWL